MTQTTDKCTKATVYQQYEFCKAVHCNRLAKSSTHADQFVCLVSTNNNCIKTAKQFHRWLTDNRFIIIRPIEDEEGNSCE